MRCLLALAAALLASCVSADVTTLPAHRLVEEREMGAYPPLFMLDDVDRGQLPSGIPIGVVQVRGDSNTGVGSLADRSAAEGRKLRAEYVVMERVGRSLELVTTPGPYLLFPSSSLANRRTASSVAYLIAPAKLGVHTNALNMVLLIENEDLRSAGLMEGDTLLTVDDVLYEPLDLRSPYLGRQFHWQPGLSVNLTWIRPGTGRMEGTVRLMENPPVHLELRDYRGRVPVLPFAPEDEDGD